MKKNNIPTVFIVEDDQDLRILYAKILIDRGFNVIGCAKNGAEGITKFNNFLEKPDVIILDYHMPLKNGIQTAKEILEFDKNTKIIFISGEESVEEEAYIVGAESFLTKSFTFEQLITEINRVIDKK